MNTRYIDLGYPLLHWAKDIIVICPKCQHDARIKGNPSWRDWAAELFCSHCGYNCKTTTRTEGWHGNFVASGRRPCCSCGYKWVSVRKTLTDASQLLADEMNARCQNCQTVNKVPVTHSRAIPADHAIDPFFGLDLALKAPTRHGTIWVYGTPHLQELKCYTIANLRENGAVSPNSSYFSRLPAWIKSAKNRELVLKALEKLALRAGKI
mgnify:CR=1 FL=1